MEDYTPQHMQQASPGAVRQQSANDSQGSSQPLQAQQTLAAEAAGVVCHNCGTLNDAEAQYCLSCGAPLHGKVCPSCGSDVDADADFCEVCHHYINRNVCSFCGAAISENDGYCPECGSPRGGIVCPVCHTLNDFSFCKQCGQPLTEDAKMLLQKVRQAPEYKELEALAHEYNELQMELPFDTERDRRRDELSKQLRERVLKLLAEDEGVENPKIPDPPKKRMNKHDLQERKKRKMEQLTELLDRMAIPQNTSPAKVRNYAMAQKPMGVRLAWLCNYKNALHSSPCGCAKPQLGGKWIVLGHNSKEEIKDDK
jgi:predicted amidophosphoribosyltransferase